jgi:hypothetical protein
MSKAQKGNKEKKKPKADKNRPKTHVSAYKAAQEQGKPSFNPFAKKTLGYARSSKTRRSELDVTRVATPVSASPPQIAAGRSNCSPLLLMVRPRRSWWPRASPSIC